MIGFKGSFIEIFLSCGIAALAAAVPQLNLFHATD